MGKIQNVRRSFDVVDTVVVEVFFPLLVREVEVDTVAVFRE